MWYDEFMVKEGEPDQAILFADELHETASPLPIEPLPATAIGGGCRENELPIFTPAEPDIVEREAPKATIREVRAVRSWLYNLLLLEVVERRIEKAESIIHRFLLIQDSASAQIGPYLVEVDAADHITVTKTGDDDEWKQPYFPEIERDSGV